MPKNRLIRYALVVFLLLPSIAFAETQEMKEHKVVKGDTLWDITQTELNDPFLWPKVWKENPWIETPHWIYPGQIIKIPLYLIQKGNREEETSSKPATTSQEIAEETSSKPTTTSQETAEETSLKPAIASQETAKVEVKNGVVQIITQPLINKSLLMASGYISNTVPGIGQIVDSPSQQIIFGNDDLVDVSVDRPIQVGDKFYVIEVSGPVGHPITGKEIGYVITIGGIVEIVKIKNGETMAMITKCFREIDRGDRLDSYYDIETPMISGNFRSPDINGMIIATGNNNLLQSMLDIIYIDKGCKDGIAAGDMFRTIAVDDHAMPNGVIQVINCKDYTATAIIKSSRTPISPGNIFTTLGNN
jgi:LysM domain